MTGNTFGTLYRVTTFGESHGPALGVVIDGCPSGLELDLEFINKELERRRPGQSKLVTPRKESDKFEVVSGLYEGKTTGSPLTMIVNNHDVRSKDYGDIKDLFRPGHAGFTYFAKYGHRDYRGGGRSSARETVSRVIAGAVAKQLLPDINIKSGVIQIGKVRAEKYEWSQVESNELRCVDSGKISAMKAEVEAARKDRDSVGGILEIVAEGVPVGLGEPLFGKLDAVLAWAMMSIPAVKGVEIGGGFSLAEMRGSKANDELYPDGFASNNHGGILGGISSGAPIVARIVLKPTSSIPRELNTIDKNFTAKKIATKGRHDPCVAIRAVPIAEAMFACVLADFWLQHLAAIGAKKNYTSYNPVKYGLRTSG